MKEEKKKAFKMPHLMVIIFCLIFFMSAMTYIIPAGQFATDPQTGQLIGSEFHFLGYQTPVSPWQAILYIKDGIVNSGTIIATLFAAGGLTGVVLATKSIDNLIDYAIYRLQNKGLDILIPLLTLVFLLFGTFSGGDYVIAMVPIGLMIAKKLKVDPIVGFSVVIVAIVLGGTSSPTNVMLPQMMMEVPLYSGFGMRLLLNIPVYIIVILYIWKYAKKVAANPASSALGLSGWQNELDADGQEAMKTAALKTQDILVTLVYFVHPIIIVILTTKMGYGQEALPAVMILTAFAIGLIRRFDLDAICDLFAKGCAGMAFVSFIIGCANAMSLVMGNGNILHTIVWALCLPLQQLGPSLAAIGIAIVVTLINLIIPSASAKVAILCPIIAPMCDALGINRQIGVTAFKYGDSITNVVSPVLGMLVGGLEVAKIPFDKYVKWIMPLVLILLVYAYATLYFLGAIGWTGL
ncbi:MAG: YfcC family protein [Clostridiales bacterium]|nr:YfcC family protein [Clostridiales bacterium]